MNNVFTTYHPIINFGFFCAVIGTGMFLQHPVVVVTGAITSLAYALMLGGKKMLKFAVIMMLAMVVLFTAFNLLINPRGVTVLFESEHVTITMEAMLYGIFSSLTLVAVVLWFSCFNKVMTSDKIIYLFGRIMPALSLVFSMVLRFVPNFGAQARKISDAQKCIGRDVSDGSIKEKVQHGIRMMGILFTWALENSIDTADSMKSRGYGLTGRSTFSLYRFDRRDVSALIFLAILTVIVIAGALTGRCDISFYPAIIVPEVDLWTVIVWGAYLMLCAFPLAVEVKEVAVWKLSQSEI